MRSAEGVVFAFRTLGKAGQAAAGAQRADAVAPPRQNLVGIGLVADVPDQAVVWRIENVMQRYRQFDHPEACAKMSSRCRYGVDRFLTQFVRDLAQLRGVEAA